MRGIVGAITLLAGLATTVATQPAAILFRDVTTEAGIAFQHHAAPEKKYIVESMSGGVAQ